MQVNARDYPGVTPEFFGMGAVVAKARDAQAVVAQDLRAASASTSTSSTTGTPAQPPTQP